MENIFLACFVFGALFTLASVVLGSAGHGAAHLGHGHAAHVHLDLGHHSAAHGSSHSETGGLSAIPWLNASSAVGSLTWFGAAGYVLLRLGSWALPAVILGALLAAGVGWFLVAKFLGLVLSGEREMDPADYRLEGTVGHVTVGIPSGGTGEVLFSKGGTRRSEAARAPDGESIPRGAEVVITSYVDGFATVQPWGEFLAAREQIAVQNRKA